MTASCFGLGATLSNFLGQLIVEKFGHVVSLAGSFIISLVPIVLFAFMPETLGLRAIQRHHKKSFEPDHYSAVI
jgi:MFS family permease